MLEAVCLKAMALAPGERYPSVRELAEDVERWLADEPVTAVRDPWWTRLRRWGRRHRAIASGLGVGAATVFAALAIATVLIERERARTEENFRKARAVVDTYFTTVSESKLLDVPGLQPLRKELLDAARQYYRDFLEEHGRDRSVRKEAAAASFRAGYIAATLGDARGAVEPYETATRLYEQLARDEPQVREHRRSLALCKGALAFVSETLEGPEAALARHREALAIREQLVREAHGRRGRAQRCRSDLAQHRGSAEKPRPARRSARGARHCDEDRRAARDGAARRCGELERAHAALRRVGERPRGPRAQLHDPSRRAAGHEPDRGGERCVAAQP
jgi:tetratricopeptide (TPR) repeat protein